jgi:hypothetical protein
MAGSIAHRASGSGFSDADANNRALDFDSPSNLDPRLFARRPARSV